MTPRRKLIIVAVVFGLSLLLAGFLLWQEQVKAPGVEELATEETDETEGAPVVSDYQNGTYIIDGVPVTLVGGYAETNTATGSASFTVTSYFGNALTTDLDGDGDEDVAFILTQNTGGTGTFFYAVSALNTGTGYVGSDGYLLGDRIAPQSTNISPNPRHKNVVVFNYADRAPDEPMTAQPSIGKSTYLKIVPETNTWAIVEPDFEGESAF